MAKALTVNNILVTSYKLFAFSGSWQQAFNQPESCGIWFIWGGSGSGKSSFVMQLCKYLTSFGKVIYNSLEEGKSKSFKDKLEKHRMAEVGSKFLVVNETFEELDKRLSSRRSPEIIVIDSWQYFNMNFEQYKAFKKKYAKKTIIFISHADGKNPEGRTAKKIMYDAYLKIWIEGYRATSKGREIGENGGVYSIWPEGENKYWGEKQIA